MDSLQSDKGEVWKVADYWDRNGSSLGDTLRQAMHDRDRFQRERDYLREQGESNGQA